MTQTPEAILHLEKCLLRPHCESDAEDVSREANNPRIAKWMTNRFPHPYRVDDAKKWMASIKSQPEVNAFVICRKDDNRAIGGIGLENRTDVNYRTMVLGYWLGEDHWGQGIVTEAVTALSQWAFEKFPHVIRNWAAVIEVYTQPHHVISDMSLVSIPLAALHPCGCEMWHVTYIDSVGGWTIAS
ncbi:predicted protein [Aspergillus terreus NIH2624]|uniref:N-acetyltransferase domain-containing protein n=1 Tax=Aspergillus terreus (strain NIH 2624 / FGSC A1156) TaxID=341663 RepID=Q0CKD1_ASPTN|nr:uncharacterized protein ATEG_05853 [Aspergillus terreus NIH2624]EAU33614.1 predicted protein [Aspergillus terreus NIH2624]